jgi:hypothetical protein
MSTDTVAALLSMSSGECRWVGRYDVHAYCRAPMVRFVRADGRTAWTRGPATYCIACPAGNTKHGNWMDAQDAADLIDSIIAKGRSNA